MSAPMKPWENMMEMNEPIVSETLNSNSGAGNGYVGVPSGVTGGSPRQRIVLPPGTIVQHQQPPPLPSRHSSRNTSSYRRYQSGYPTSAFYGGYHGANPYGDFGYTSRRIGASDDFESRFIQLAEESSAPAFQSIEAFVRSFSSFTMMLESTYQAMYMSFRAVLSVADNVAKLRHLLRQFATSIALLRTLRWFYFRLRRLLGLVSNVRSEEVWMSAMEQTASGTLTTAANTIGGAFVGGAVARGNGGTRSVWPLIAFFGLVVGGPYLILKLLKIPSSGNAEWTPEDPNTSLKCVALYNFDPSQSNELGFRQGDHLLIAKEPTSRSPQGGWIMASTLDGSSIGYVPANRIGILKPGMKLKQNRSTVEVTPNIAQPVLSVEPEPVLQDPTTCEEDDTERAFIHHN